MLDVTTLTVVITAVSGAITAVIPFAAKFAANRSEAVKAAGISRDEDIQLLKDLLQRCRREKAELVKLATENGKYPTIETPPHETT